MSAWSHQGCLQRSSSSEGNIHCTKPVIIKTVDVKIVNLHLIVSYNYFGSHLVWEETCCFPELCTILQSHQQCMIVPVSQHLYLLFFFHLFYYIYLSGYGKWYIIVLLFLLYVLPFCTVSYVRNTHFFFPS